MIILAQRQSPNWSNLSLKYRLNNFVDRNDYVPDHPIIGFPDDIESLIKTWNDGFKIDFFTFRAKIAAISRHNVSLVADAKFVSYGETDKFFSLGSEGFVYFYDDDDLFAPDMACHVALASSNVDAIVTPLFRIGNPTFTLIKPNASSELVIGDRMNFNFRFQTNNYGINLQRCRNIEQYYAIKDHVNASQYAKDQEFVDMDLSIPLSATIKTPASASMLRRTFATPSSPTVRFNEFIAEQRRVLTALQPGNDWLAQPLSQIVQLCEIVIDGGDYAAMDNIMK